LILIVGIGNPRECFKEGLDNGGVGEGILCIYILQRSSLEFLRGPSAKVIHFQWKVRISVVQRLVYVIDVGLARAIRETAWIEAMAANDSYSIPCPPTRLPAAYMATTEQYEQYYKN
jgi:hypothetical protein